MFIDMHCDTLGKIRDLRNAGNYSSLMDADSLQVNIKKMKTAGYDLQNFAVFINLAENRDPFENAMELVDIFEQELCDKKEYISAVKSYADIEKNMRENRMSALLTLEEGGMCCGDPNKLMEFYRRGARMMTICWNYENELGYGAACVPENAGFFGKEQKAAQERYGLKKKGFEFIELMEEIGMIPDVSHLSDDGFYDVCKAAGKPFVASHSNARSVCGHPRNLTDDMLRQMGERGCVAGLNFYPAFLNAQADYTEGLKSIAEHAAHMISKGGSELVGLGTDYDGFGGGSMPEDCSGMMLLEDAFKKAGLSASQIDGIFAKNVLRLYREVLR